MVTKKQQAIDPNLLDQLEEDKNVERTKQRSLDAQKEKDQGGGVSDPKGKGSAWRINERKKQKSIHFDGTLNTKINLLSQLENKPIEDILYDIIAEWFNNHFDERKKELLGQL